MKLTRHEVVTYTLEIDSDELLALDDILDLNRQSILKDSTKELISVIHKRIAMELRGS